LKEELASSSEKDCPFSSYKASHKAKILSQSVEVQVNIISPSATYSSMSLKAIISASESEISASSSFCCSSISSPS